MLSISVGKPLRVAFLGLLLAFVGCASLPTDFDKPVTEALPAAPEASLQTIVQPYLDDNRTLSGFTLLNEGAHSYRSRIALINHAQDSVDAQYYLWRTDVSGRNLVVQLWEAAERGVRVRILIDDIDTAGRDFNVLVYDSHPNIAVRFFNPFGTRGKKLLRKTAEFVTTKRLNRRMHNKIFVVDGTLAIVGGRNIGDRYFGINEKFNFRDLDLLAAGPVVADISHSFDSYWNSPWAYPVAALTKKEVREGDTERLLADRAAYLEENAEILSALELNEDLDEELSSDVSNMTWAHASVVFDEPAKVDTKEDLPVRSAVAEKLRQLADDLERELFIQTAYFVPGKSATAELVELASEGVEVIVQTNSLASNNHAIAHSGYMPYRKRLLQGGVELYEVRPDAKSRELYMVEPTPKHTLGLHSKVIVFDRDVVFVGTFNFDPRSIELNTEMGLLIESEALAERLLEAFGYDMLPENSWQVKLDGRERLRWHVVEEGETRIYAREPKVGLGRRFAAGFFRILPLESQL